MIFGQYCLVDKCIETESLLIDFKSIPCKNCSLPIHLKYVESFGWKHNNCYYCCHDCMIGEKMNIDGYPYKFVTIFESDTISVSWIGRYC